MKIADSTYKSGALTLQQKQQLENKVAELCAILQGDILRMQTSISQLEQLRCFVIKRDDEALSELLEQIRTGTVDYTGNELERRKLRREIADILGWDMSLVTLSNIASVVNDSHRIVLLEQLKQLRELVSRFNQEHVGTKMLVSDCARFNSALLRTVFGLKDTAGVVYGPSGTTSRQAGLSIMDMKF